jgi:hypothetical protein
VRNSLNASVVLSELECAGMKIQVCFSNSRSTLRAADCGGVPDVTAVLACHDIAASFPDGRTGQSAVLSALIVQPLKRS